MKLLEILLHELEDWPEGKEYAFQSTTNSMAFFSASHKDGDPKSIQLCQLATDRGPDHKVSREEWEVAKIKSLPFFPEVAAILGKEAAVEELLAVGEINYTAKELDEAFVFGNTPQGFSFWSKMTVPNREGKEGNELREALELITAAMSSEHFIQLHIDGSGSVRDIDNNKIITFTNIRDLVSEYLAPTPKFEHWDVLQDRFQWVAKDLDGAWWAYENRPILEYGVRNAWDATKGDYHSLEAMKVDIPCHWRKSLIKRPSTKE